VEADQALGQQRRAHHHDDRSGDLERDEDAARPAADPVAAATARALQRVVRIGAARRECRRQAEQQPDGDGNRHHEQQQLAVDGDARNPSDLCGPEDREGLERVLQEDERGNASQHGEQHTLDQHLPHQASAPGAERGANGQFLPPHGRSREEQVGDIGAPDEEHARDRTEQHRDWRAEVAIEALVLRHDADPAVADAAREALRA
jgi:hypothetical protein